MQKVIIFFVFNFLLIGLLNAQQKGEAIDVLEIPSFVNRPVKVKNASLVNSPNLEFSPAFFHNGIVYVKEQLSKEEDGHSFFQLFFTELDGHGVPGTSIPFLTELNTTAHYGPVAFNFSEDVIYYTVNSLERSKKGKFTLDVAKARKEGDEWINDHILPFNSSEYSVMHPSVSVSGDKLFFASDLPGGFGGTDIYFVEKEGAGWSAPVNMGATVNSNKNEAFPFIHETGMLFFASEGHGGMGGYDIFAVNTWRAKKAERIHLEAPINSTEADFGLILNPLSSRGYFTSARAGGGGQDDIYSIDIPGGLITQGPSNKVWTKIEVYDEKDNSLIEDAALFIFEKTGSHLSGEEQLYEKVMEIEGNQEENRKLRLARKINLGYPEYYTDQDGQVFLYLDLNSSYLLVLKKEGFATIEHLYQTSEDRSFVAINIPMQTINCVRFSGLVTDETSGHPVSGAKIFIRSGCNENFQVVNTTDTGIYSVCLLRDCMYQVGVEKFGFKLANLSWSTQNSEVQTIEHNIQLLPVRQDSIQN